MSGRGRGRHTSTGDYSLTARQPKQKAGCQMSEKIYTFDEWEAGQVPKTPEDEIFRAVFGPQELGYLRGHSIGMTRKLIYYEGETSGVRLGAWFAEVMEPV
jgi:hypothetical protein